jgi:hypothetical protein
VERGSEVREQQQRSVHKYFSAILSALTGGAQQQLVFAAAGGLLGDVTGRLAKRGQHAQRRQYLAAVASMLQVLVNGLAGAQQPQQWRCCGTVEGVVRAILLQLLGQRDDAAGQLAAVEALRQEAARLLSAASSPFALMAAAQSVVAGTAFCLSAIHVLLVLLLAAAVGCCC